jgi:hypothetical protein
MNFSDHLLLLNQDIMRLAAFIPSQHAAAAAGKVYLKLEKHRKAKAESRSEHVNEPCAMTETTGSHDSRSR